MSEMRSSAADTANSPGNTKWAIDASKSTVKVEVSASYDTNEADASITVRAATPAAARSLIASLASLAEGAPTAGNGDSADVPDRLDALINTLSGPFAQAAELWWRNLSGADVFTKTYPSLAARTKAVAATSKTRKVSLCQPQKRNSGNTNKGGESNKSEGGSTSAKTKGSKSASDVPTLEIQVSGLRKHQYKADGPTFMYGKPLCNMVKIGISSTFLSTTGGDSFSPLQNLRRDDPWFVALTDILNQAIHGTRRIETERLPAQPLHSSTVAQFDRELLKLAAHVAQGGEVRARQIDADADLGPRPDHTLDLNVWQPASSESDTLYSQHALNPDTSQGLPHLHSTGAPQLSTVNGMLTLSFEGCLTGRTPTEVCRTTDRVPSGTLLSVAATAAVTELNVVLDRHPRKSADSWTKTTATQKRWLADWLMATMGSVMFRSARASDLQAVSPGRTTIAQSSNELLLDPAGALRVEWKEEHFGEPPSDVLAEATRLSLQPVHGVRLLNLGQPS